MLLRDFSVLTFDCYGTLIDWESGMLKALAPLTERLDPPLSPDDILAAHALEESDQQARNPTQKYGELLATVHRRLAEKWGVNVTWRECEIYGRSVADWPAFPDAQESLAYLKRHYKLAILSNIDNESFAHSAEKLGIAFDAVYTAEDIGSYKPDDKNFAYMLAHLRKMGVKPDAVLHTAESMFHDHVPARRAGLANCLIYRRHDKKGFGATRPPENLPETDFRFHSMADMVAAHKSEA